MVRVYGATFGDVTDRAARLLGVVGIDELANLTDISDRAARELGAVSVNEIVDLINHPRAWWVRQARGRISYIDDFEDTLNFTQSTGTATKASDASYVHGGASAMKLVTGATAGNEAEAEAYIAPLAEESLYATLGCWICLSAAADNTPRDIILSWYVGDRTLDANYVFRLRFLYHLTTMQKKLQYESAAPAWVDISGGTADIRVVEPQFHYFEIRIRRVAGTAWQYYQVRMNDRIFDLSGIAAFAGSFTKEEQYIALKCTTDAAFATTMYADDLAVIDSLDAAP